MKPGQCLACKRIALLFPDLCAICEDKYGGDENAGIRQAN